jgi:uridine kinase
VSAERPRVLRRVADMVPARGDDCALVGIDGPDGAGKTVFADELADVLRAAGRPVVRVSVDDFHHPRAVRYRRGRDSPEGYWLDSFDYDRLRADVLRPLGPGGDRRFRPAAHDLRTDRELRPAAVLAPPGAIAVVDGVFLHRDELAGTWDLSVFLDVPFEVTARRMAARDGSHPDPGHPSMRRYVGGQRIYFATCRPRERATVVVDNTDLDAPRIVTPPGQWG